MKKPTISVIVPVYNAEKTIVKCMESIYVQSFQDFEVILINDGSTDKSGDYIKAYIATHFCKQWKLISRENKGVSRTRNEGIKLSEGEYIAFIDADDLWHQDKLVKQITLMRTTEAVIVGSKLHGKESKGFQRYELCDMLLHNRLYTSTVLVKKSVVEEVSGFDESMGYSEDYNLWLKIACHHSIFVLNEALVTYDFLHLGGGLSRNIWEMEKGELSNYHQLYKHHDIGYSWYVRATVFSFMKFMVRYVRHK